MNDHPDQDWLEPRLRRMLGRRAEHASEGEQLVATANRRGRQLVARRRVLVGLTGVAVAAIAAPVGTRVLGDGRQSTRIEPSRRKHADPRPRGSIDVQVDLERLSKGAAPRVPYYSAADTQIHDGDRTIDVDAEPSDFVLFAPIDGGYVVQVGDLPATSEVIDADGKRIRTLPIQNEHVASAILPAIAADGGRIAWSAFEGDTGEGTVVVAARWGDLVGEKPFGKGTYVWPVGFVGDRVLLASDADDGYAELWDPETDEVSDLELDWPFATDGSRYVVSAQRSMVFDAIADTPSWRPAAGSAFSGCLTKDGRYALMRHGDDAQTLFVHDLDSGNRLLRIEARSRIDRAVPEPDGDLLLGVYQRIDGEDVMALVRCSVRGEVELATDFASGDSAMPLALPLHR